MNSCVFSMRILPSIVFSFLVCSCSSFISTSGPSVLTIQEHARKLENETLLIDVDDKVIKNHVIKPRTFSDIAQTPPHSGQIGVGDILEVTIWESPPAVLFSGPINQNGSGSAHVMALPPQVVNNEGFIKVPFAGSIRVKEQTPTQVASKITKRLESKANQPQVLVRLIENNSATVTIVRDGKSIRMPLTERGERVLDALTAIGGTNESINKTSLQLTRGNKTYSQPLANIIRDPEQNVILKPGDVVSALYQPLNFVVLGAAGKNQEISFENEGITLAQALGRIGGLNDNRANAKGIFVFRYESVETFASLPETPNTLNGLHPVVYRIDLQNPDSFFYAKDFVIRDKDVLYISNAPATELQKFFRALFSWLSPVVTTSNTVS